MLPALAVALALALAAQDAPVSNDAVPSDTAPAVTVPSPIAPTVPSTVAPAVAPTVAPAVAGKVKVIVLDMKGSALAPSERAALGSLVTVSLSELAALDVVSGAELREMIELEGQKQAVGCEESASCLAELAGALGARIVAFGGVEKLGSLYIFTLTLQDTKTNAPAGRIALRGDSVDALAQAVPDAVQKMAMPFLESEKLPVTTSLARKDAPPSDQKMLAWVGGVTAIVGAGVFAATYVGGVAFAADRGFSPEGLDTLRVPVAGKLALAANDSSDDNTTLAVGILEAAAAAAALGGAVAFGAAQVMDGPELDGAGNAWRWGLVGGGAALALGGIAFDTASPTSSDRRLDGADIVAPALQLVGVSAALVGITTNPFQAGAAVVE